MIEQRFNAVADHIRRGHVARDQQQVALNDDLLVVHVIARFLGAHHVADQIFAWRGAPQLDPVERVLVPFARETIWYEPAPLQRRARALQERLTNPQVLEAIGVAAMANGLCRMGAMVLDPQ